MFIYIYRCRAKQEHTSSVITESTKPGNADILLE